MKGRQISVERKAASDIAFEREQLQWREWVCFAEIADEYAAFKRSKTAVDQASYKELVLEAFELLSQDIRAGFFEPDGQCCIWFRYYVKDFERLTAELFEQAYRTFEFTLLVEAYLSRSWIPEAQRQRWARRHHLPILPDRFKPTLSGKRVFTAKDERGAADYLSERLRVAPNLTKRAAMNLCRQADLLFSSRGFSFRIWPQARTSAGLPASGRSGRPKKSGTPKP